MENIDCRQQKDGPCAGLRSLLLPSFCLRLGMLRPHAHGSPLFEHGLYPASRTYGAIAWSAPLFTIVRYIPRNTIFFRVVQTKNNPTSLQTALLKYKFTTHWGIFSVIVLWKTRFGKCPVRNSLKIHKIGRSEEWGKSCNRNSRPGMYCCYLLANSAHNTLCPLFWLLVLLLMGEMHEERWDRITWHS